MCDPLEGARPASHQRITGCERVSRLDGDMDCGELSPSHEAKCERRPWKVKLDVCSTP